MRSIFPVFLAILAAFPAQAEAPQVRGPDQPSHDARLGPAKTLNDHFPFVVPDNVAQWHSRAEMLRRRVLVATGLWPMPEKTPLDAVIYGKTEREGFTVEKVYFQSLPGHYVTGLLFRPTTPTDRPVPGVLCPHGHGGRMQRLSDAELESQLTQGAEHFAESGRTPKLARCAQLARMGCVSFIFDMLGYEDSIQIPFEVAHRHKDPRPEETMPNEQGWVFFSAEADLRCQSVMGLQTWNAIRALDFLASLPEVDTERLAVTGGSGGGTQSILLGAIDDRIKVSFPNGMVSTSMQGGCYCENCNLLRIDTGNVELAALFAPRPQAMTAADDWTRDMMTDGYPQLKWLYAMIGNEADVYCRPMLNFPHNYNYVTRATMYQWMNRHLQLGLDDPVIEQNFLPLTEDQTSVWSEEHPRPSEVGIDHERSVCRWLDSQAQGILNSKLPRDTESLEAFREMFGGAWQILFDQGVPEDVEIEQLGQTTIDSIRIEKGLVRCPSRKTELPLLSVRDSVRNPQATIIWTAEQGKAVGFDASGKPTALLREMVQQGFLVLLPDLMRQGEWGGDTAETGQRLVNDERSYSAFTFGYNRSLTAERCSDLLTIIGHAATQGHAESKGDERHLILLSSDQSAPWAATAAAMAGPLLSHAIIAVDGFRFAQAGDYHDPNFVPGAVKYGDIPTILALRAPHGLSVLGEAELPRIVSQAYASAGAQDQLQHSSDNQLDVAAIKGLDQ